MNGERAYTECRSRGWRFDRHRIESHVLYEIHDASGCCLADAWAHGHEFAVRADAPGRR